jgi:hypothetical protein
MYPIYIIISPPKASEPRSCRTSMSTECNSVFNQKQKELLKLFSSGMASFNWCMAEMYKAGKSQGERR